MDSLFSSSTSLFFGRSAAAHEAPTVDETPIMPPAFDEPNAPVPAASNDATAAPTVVRLGDNNETLDDEAEFAASMIVSDLLSNAVKPKAKTPTPAPSGDGKTDKNAKVDNNDAIDEVEKPADASNGRRRSAARASVAHTPSNKSTARTPRTTKRKATEEPAETDTPTTTKRGRAAKAASAEKETEKETAAPLPAIASLVTQDDEAVKAVLADPVEEEMSNDEDDDIPAVLPSATKATPGKKRGRPSMGKTAAKAAATTPAKPSFTASGARRGRPPGKTAPKTRAVAPVKDRPLTGRQAALQAHRIANPLPVPAAPKVSEAAPKKRGRPSKTATLTASGKKRGRPTKAEAEASAAAPKKGRPPKKAAAAATTTTKAASSDAPKKRGRPSKADTAAAAGADAPKKKGRPSKADAAATTAAASPKKRGRPAGSASVTATAASPKKRGRPAGSAAATATPKKRGRPSLAATAASAAKPKPVAASTETPKKRGRPPASAAATPAATPGKRGRPAGSTTKPKSTVKKGEYVVESIVEHRSNPITAAVEYRVKWKGYPSSDNTWEPKRNLKGCDEVLLAYEKHQQ